MRVLEGWVLKDISAVGRQGRACAKAHRCKSRMLSESHRTVGVWGPPGEPGAALRVWISAVVKRQEPSN